MKRFSGTVIPAPSSVTLVWQYPYAYYKVLWGDATKSRIAANIIVKNGNVSCEKIECIGYVQLLATLDDYAESAILNVQARIK